jgi:hypothetical protein
MVLKHGTARIFLAGVGEGGGRRIFAYKPTFKPFEAISIDRPIIFRGEE